MLKIILFFCAASAAVYPQSDQFSFNSVENKKKFADFLYCEGDYLRAVEEYKNIRDQVENDTVDYKIILCYSYLNLSESINSIRREKIFSLQSPFIYDIQYTFLKNDFINSSLVFFNAYDSSSVFFPVNSVYYRNFQKLWMSSYLFYDRIPVSKEKFLQPFEEPDKERISYFYDWVEDPPYKSPALAGILSAVIPGSGKMYTGEWGDGITAFLVTGLFAFLAYDNFHADHNTRAWIFTGLCAFFYAGNIYGSIASAQIFNARINFDFYDGLKSFLEQKNYFQQEYDFCN